MTQDILLPYDIPEVLYKFHRLPIVNGRLTLTTAVPVTTSDVTGASTVYFTPYLGNYISLWNGNWNVYEFEEASLDISSLAAATLYNVYGYWDGQELQLDASTTATATQDGRLVKSGDPTRLYLGTIYTSGSGVTSFNQAQKFVWNYYNRLPMLVTKVDATSHTYGTATYRYWNNNTANKVEFCIGVVESPIYYGINMDTTAGASATAYVVAAINATSNPGPIAAISTGIRSRGYQRDAVMPTVGYNYISALEYATATSTFSSMYLVAEITG